MLPNLYFLALVWIMPLLVECDENYLDPYYDSPPIYGDMNICKGNLRKIMLGSEYSAGCMPSEGYGSEKITSPAMVRNIDVSFFLNKDSNPALRISFKSMSPDSAQQYNINVMGNSPLPLLCGKVKTSKPNSEGKKVLHSLGVEMRCPGALLKTGTELSVIVTPTFGVPRRKYVQLPGCNDKVMRKTIECEELRENEIRFSLRQEGNATVVVLVTRTAYRDGNKKVYLRLRLRKDGYLDGWKEIGKHVVLVFPQRSTRFEDLTPGETYSVQVWRDGDLYWTTKSITIKEDYKTPAEYH